MGYGASRAALIRFTETLAAESKAYSVKDLALRPDLVRTALTEYQIQSEEGKRWFPHMDQRFEKGHDVPSTLAVSLVVELASDRFAAVTGRH